MKEEVKLAMDNSKELRDMKNYYLERKLAIVIAKTQSTQYEYEHLKNTWNTMIDRELKLREEIKTINEKIVHKIPLYENEIYTISDDIINLQERYMEKSNILQDDINKITNENTKLKINALIARKRINALTKQYIKEIAQLKTELEIEKTKL